MRASLTANSYPAEPGQDQALEYYESVRAAFARAGGHVEHRLEIAGTGLSLRFAGQGLAPALLPALSWLASPACPREDIVVELWDRATTGIDIPEPPWRLRDVVARGDVRGLSGARIRAQVDTGNEMLTLWDCARRRGITWTTDARCLPYWLRAAPLRSILHWGLASEGRHLLHAAAVGDERAGALLVGPSGSGKSTTALACLDDDLGYVADDYVLAETASSPRAFGLYGTAKLGASSSSLLPALVAEGHHAGEEKLVVDVAGARPELMRRCASISAILLPRVTPGRLTLRPVGAAQALRALAPSTILQHADESAGGMAVISALVRRVPAYVLDLGSDITAVAPAISALLERSR